MVSAQEATPQPMVPIDCAQISEPKIQTSHYSGLVAYDASWQLTNVCPVGIYASTRLVLYGHSGNVLSTETTRSWRGSGYLWVNVVKLYNDKVFYYGDLGDVARYEVETDWDFNKLPPTPRAVRTATPTLTPRVASTRPPPLTPGRSKWFQERLREAERLRRERQQPEATRLPPALTPVR